MSPVSLLLVDGSATFDPVQLGFTFAKELATQLITLSTGILALSITYTKDILKGIPDKSSALLKTSWGVHLSSVLCGIWTLMALTGTLVPAGSSATPINGFDANIRGPAALQVITFIAGTLLLMIVHGRARAKTATEQFSVAAVPLIDAAAHLQRLRLEQWEIVSCSPQGECTLVVVAKRPG